MPQYRDFTVAGFKRSPARYRFFSVGENVWFGDEVKHRRFDADPEYAERHELRSSWCLNGGDFEDAKTARWLAEQLNKGTGR